MAVKILKQVGVVSLARPITFCCAFVGLLFGTVTTIATQFAGDTVSESIVSTLGIQLEYSWLAIILLPIICGAMGFLSVILMVALLNLALKLFGGVELYFEDELEVEQEVIPVTTPVPETKLPAPALIPPTPTPTPTV